MKVKSSHLERLFYFFPVFGRITHLLLGLFLATETTPTYSDSYQELSEMYGKYKDVIINDPKPESTPHYISVYTKWARFRLQVFESLQGLQDEKMIRGKSC